MAHPEAPASRTEFLVLRDAERLISEGKLTVALIRPGIDVDTTNRIIRAIRKPLTVVFQLPLELTENAVNEFYEEDPKRRMLAIPSVSGKYANRWEELVRIMTKGPATMLLLYTSNSNAVDEWRSQMGDHWDPAQNPRGTIRREFAKSAYNNLTHGSDCRQSAHREFTWLLKQLARLYNSDLQPGEAPRFPERGD